MSPSAHRSVLVARIRWLRRTLSAVLRNRPAVVGILILAVLVLAALSPAVLHATVWADEPSVYRPTSGYDPDVIHPGSPSWRHLLGTDPLGRDVLSMLLYTLRSSLVLGLVSALTIGVVGLAFAMAGATAGGVTDRLLSKISDAVLLLPAPIFVILYGVLRPEDFDPLPVGLVYGLLAGASSTAIVLRAHALSVLEKPFIEAGRVAGGGRWHLARVHLLPHLLPLAAVQMVGGVASVIIAAGFVEYLSAAAMEMGLGTMIYVALTYRGMFGNTVPWNVLLTGGLAISLLAGAFHLLSVGLRQVLDPTLQRRRV